VPIYVREVLAAFDWAQSDDIVLRNRWSLFSQLLSFLPDFGAGRIDPPLFPRLTQAMGLVSKRGIARCDSIKSEVVHAGPSMANTRSQDIALESRA
jgi:hypothetical protein